MKSLARAKTRLSPLLSPEQRRGLALALFEQTLHILDMCHSLNGILVTSRDPDILALTPRLCGRAQALHENTGHHLNSALDEARRFLVDFGASRLLVIPADLPFLSVQDVYGMLNYSQRAQVVLAPDRYEEGTNALCLCPPHAIPFAFGRGSFQHHQGLAQQAALGVRVYASARLGLDLDTPDDLQACLAHQPELESQPLAALRLAS
jgi:2-phospho-L-lactate guanylyltransferase